MEPVTMSLVLSGAKLLWGKYKEIEAENAGVTPQQLKARLDALDDVVRGNLQVIEQLSTQVQLLRWWATGASALAALALVATLVLAVTR